MNEEALKDAVAMLEGAEKPFVFIGGGAVLSGASREIMEFVNKLDAPVTDSLMGKGAFPGTASALYRDARHARDEGVQLRRQRVRPSGRAGRKVQRPCDREYREVRAEREDPSD